MARTATITLDEKKYVIHALNVGEIQSIGEILTGGTNNLISTMKVLSIAMRRAEPPMTEDEFGKIEATVEELNTAITALLKLSGMEVNPQMAAPAVS